MRRESPPRGNQIGINARNNAERIAAFIWWAGTTLIVLPYFGPIGWRLAFVIADSPRYANRWLDGYFWRASWGMSGDLVYGSVDGSYRGWDVVFLIRLLVLAAGLFGAQWIRRTPAWFGVVCALGYLGACSHVCIDFDFSGWFFVAALLGMATAGSEVRPLGFLMRLTTPAGIKRTFGG